MKARGVGEKMASVGVSGSSVVVVTSSAGDTADQCVLAAQRQQEEETYFVKQCRECEEQA